MNIGFEHLIKDNAKAADNVSKAIVWAFGASGALLGLVAPFPRAGAAIAAIGAIARAWSYFTSDEPKQTLP